MANSLLTGISGLRGHQKMLEVVGNNLANLNTTAYKSSRVLFSDMMYELQRGATSSSSGLLGSVNAVQIGTGSRLAQVDLNFAQGNLEATGNDFDLGIDGAGFFVASSPDRTYFTRAGAFSLDESGYLSDPSTGYLVKRFGTTGEPDGTLPAFQTPGDDRVYIPKGGNIPGKLSTEILMKGNLASTATGPIAQELMTSTPFLACRRWQRRWVRFATLSSPLAESRPRYCPPWRPSPPRPCAQPWGPGSGCASTFPRPTSPSTSPSTTFVRPCWATAWPICTQPLAGR